ncbi:MAG: leucine--tRNA ligase [Candidatus Methanomethylicaceae archaeon]|jgi:leucyl-tRNA synthetase
MSLDFRLLEEKWQKRWSDSKVFEADPDPSKPKYYVTVAYPYPNAPQHIGHARTYTLADVHARYMRMKGFNTLLPMAFHYTGTPILAMSKRIASGDTELLHIFKDLYGVPEDAIKTFNVPVNIARYFHREIKGGMQEMGYSIDWRREFTTIDPSYSKFIEWQFHTLSSKNLITKGAHPIGWCPSDKNPVGQHDTQGDFEPEVGEFTAIKFDLDGTSLPTATLRPETIFGVTNIWINPEAVYVEVDMKGERIVVSKQASTKLCEQMTCIAVIRELKGSDLAGRYATNPISGSKVPILPAEFVDPDNATGVVMSVPAHAPYDLLALRDIKAKPDILSKYGIDTGIIAKIEPIPVVQLSGFSPIPAQDVINSMKVKDQLDPRAEAATKELYQKEFHTAHMLPETGKYAGLAVSKAKEMVKKDLISANKAFLFYEILNGPIYCRCGAKVTVNLLSDQWFINYGDEGWKEIVREHLGRMSILPEDLRQEFINVVEWLREKACARRSGLGTPLPWDRDWIIESLSDSTIYMAYYTIARILREAKIDPSVLSDSVFDYVFLGRGDHSKLGIDRSTAEAMRREFTYFYPLDSRHSGRDLVPNHLTFFIFNHVAIFPEEYWPRQIAVNGSVLMDGKKMSKSFGNIIPLRKAIKIYGADTLRVSILSASELMQDVDFSDVLAKSTKARLQEFYSFAIQYADADPIDVLSMDALDHWLASRVQKAILQTTAAMDCLRAREAIQTALFALQQDIMWYFRRRHNCCNDPKARGIVKYALEKAVRMMSPFAPHLCEEIWEQFGNTGFASVAEWPQAEASFINEVAEISEELLKDVVEDTAEIVKVTGIVPSKICYYCAPEWKWDIYLKLLALLEGGADPKTLIKEAMKDPDIRARGGDAAKFIATISPCVVSMPKEQRRRLVSSIKIEEEAFLKVNSDFLSSYFRCPVEVYPSDSPAYDPKKKAGIAVPLRPAIYVEGSACSE